MVSQHRIPIWQKGNSSHASWEGGVVDNQESMSWLAILTPPGLRLLFYVSSSTSPILGKIPATVSKHRFTRKAPRILPPATADGGVALLPKHLFHQPLYLSFDTGAPLPCLRWVSQVLLQLQTHLNLNCIMQVYDFSGVVVCGKQLLQWEERVGSPPKNLPG